MLALALSACTDDRETVRTLHAAGFTDVHTTGWSPFMCSKDDTFETGFVAKNPQGAKVKGTVCCGFLFKGCTVRF
jgi:hypothetical protein